MIHHGMRGGLLFDEFVDFERILNVGEKIGLDQ